MDSSAPVIRGAHELRHLLQEQTFDLRRLDLSGFRRWLESHLVRWHQNPVFVQRVRIRDLRRAHPRLRILEEEHRHAAGADAASAQFPRLRRLEQELINTTRAISGLTAALERAPPERRPALQQKLDAFQVRQQALRDEQAQLLQSSPQRQALLRSAAELQQLRAAIGLDQEDDRLDQLLKRQGRRAGHSGAAFEQLTLTLTQTAIVPDLLPASAEASQRLRVLRGVTLGAARTEFDQLVIRQPDQGGQPVEVLALVEVKRNINDLAHGFRRRQENLAWLTGDSGHYDPALYRTRHFPSGHFDRAATHQHEGETMLFAPGSFHRFQRDPATGQILDHLYFITRAGALWGVSTMTLARIAWRVATDQRWEPDSDSYLGKLRHWCQSLTEPIETPDVLPLYTSTPERGRQILVIGR